MTHHFYNDWFSYYFNNDPNQKVRNSKTDTFNVDFTKCNIVLPFREAVKYNNEKLKEAANNKPIVLLLSGGHDSHYAAKTMAEDGIDFTAITFDYLNGRNSWEVDQATTLCNELNIKQQIIPLDMLALFGTGEYKKYSDLTHCNTMWNYVYMHGIKDIDAFVVTGQGDQDFAYKDGKRFWKFGEQILSLLTYANMSNKPGLVRYWSYTDVLFYSTYYEMFESMKISDSYFEYKNDFFVSLGLPSKTKKHGFEWFLTDEFKSLRHSIHKYLITTYPTHENDVQLMINEMAGGTSAYIQVDSKL